ncbi:MAG: low molecular weight phosphotyrosine protein phosphatase [Actinobacteria bacterium]|nr:low molecular weight phosphotyrosine protein phosphatase [Actinomycetota bacterium]
MTSPPTRIYRVTIVCLGNICRSPIGEAVLRERLTRSGLAGVVEVDSAGTGDWHVGQGANPRSVQVLDDHGYAHHHTARQIDERWFADIDLVIAMDTANYADLKALIPSTAHHVELRMLRSFDPALAGISEPDARLDVPDPYHGTDEDFITVLHMVESAVDGLMGELPELIAVAR